MRPTLLLHVNYRVINDIWKLTVKHIRRYIAQPHFKIVDVFLLVGGQFVKRTGVYFPFHPMQLIGIIKWLVRQYGIYIIATIGNNVQKCICARYHFEVGFVATHLYILRQVNIPTPIGLFVKPVLLHNRSKGSGWHRIFNTAHFNTINSYRHR